MIYGRRERRERRVAGGCRNNGDFIIWSDGGATA